MSSYAKTGYDAKFYLTFDDPREHTEISLEQFVAHLGYNPYQKNQVKNLCRVVVANAVLEIRGLVGLAFFISYFP
ncbi:MAG: hypothetical protein UR28_C0010G0052 [Candidatus Peregrinibacteria bacterium GW2011_GWF2_33_10]|nr:MAG: hypothetical protein UR28_C0010G0052 [Candidatus Peregrinibacteria bacterium GW2011_GWF2_33_10]OGJ46100.1 MAG: hypothetical protein A2272_05235 [Candidatus Peregrinibacteria bacterium RIFOXYA12_FULL_33_12]OGJ46195.1 MAG: hypothetical protein A2263_04890 [Candidatus Peregrinibacteria bacterium RIFOXYA2_FULL_33_21]OGJ51611.1 MAG: hypothetical protein A2307_04060 [Candidatus Peregrinibacteria bacterium RIFOXYB2_FULL_33_20]